jgi:hypothetical protein
VTEVDAELRQAIAAEHGLDHEAARFLTGATLAELEQSASALARLLAERREEEPEPVPVPVPVQDFFAAAAEAKARRKAELAAIFTGRAPEQPRDAKGRWIGFDGGVRQPIPARRSPEEEHNQLVAQLAGLSRTFRGAVA